MTEDSVRAGRFDGLLDGFVDKVHGVLHAVLISGDGFLLARSAGVDATIGSQLAAMCSTQLSLTRNISALVASNPPHRLDLGDCDYLLIRLADGFVVIKEVDPEAGLVVVAHAGCDLQVVGSETSRFVESVGHALTPAVRRDLSPQLTASRHDRG